MARPKKTGLDYFPFDADFFTDTKIRAVKAHYGVEGISLYIYCLCEIYPKGFFCCADEDFCDCAAADLGLTDERVAEILQFFCRKSLFDGRLFQERGVLTSAAVQSRFQEACKSFHREFTVDGTLWLLPPEETLPFINTGSAIRKQLEDNGFLQENPGFSQENPGFLQEKCTKESKEKESKAEESKEKEIKADESKKNQTKANESKAEESKAPAERLAAANNNSFSAYNSDKASQADNPYDLRIALSKMYGEQNVREYEQKFRSWAAKQGHINAAMYPTISRWMEQDCIQKNYEEISSADYDDVMEELRRQYST